MHILYNAPINVKPAEGGGGLQGMGWGFDIFQKFAVKFPAHGHLRRIQKPSRESPHFVSLNIIVLSKGYKESQFYKLTVIVANEPYTDQLYLQKSTSFLFTSFTLIPQYLKRFS